MCTLTCRRSSIIDATQVTDGYRTELSLHCIFILKIQVTKRSEFHFQLPRTLLCIWRHFSLILVLEDWKEVMKVRWREHWIDIRVADLSSWLNVQTIGHQPTSFRKIIVNWRQSYGNGSKRFILPLDLTLGLGSPIHHVLSTVVPTWGKHACTKTYRRCPSDWWDHRNEL